MFFLVHPALIEIYIFIKEDSIPFRRMFYEISHDECNKLHII